MKVMIITYNMTVAGFEVCITILMEAMFYIALTRQLRAGDARVRGCNAGIE